MTAASAVNSAPAIACTSGVRSRALTALRDGQRLGQQQPDGHGRDAGCRHARQAGQRQHLVSHACHVVRLFRSAHALTIARAAALVWAIRRTAADSRRTVGRTGTERVSKPTWCPRFRPGPRSGLKPDATRALKPSDYLGPRRRRPQRRGRRPGAVCRPGAESPAPPPAAA